MTKQEILWELSNINARVDHLFCILSDESVSQKTAAYRAAETMYMLKGHIDLLMSRIVADIKKENENNA